MTDDTAQPATEVAEVLMLMQDQIDALTATVEDHQRIFERLRSLGVFDPVDGEPR